MDIKLEIAVEEEFMCMLAGVQLGEYYASADVMLDTQIAAKEILEERYGMGKFVHLFATLTSYAEASALGLDVVFPEGNKSPWPKHRKLLESIDEVDDIHIRRNHGSNLVERTIKYFHKMRQKAGDRYNITIEKCVGGPVTTAVMLKGQEFFMDIYDDPVNVHKLLEKITNNSLDIRRQIEKATGQEMTVTWIYDDYAGMLSPQLYREFAVPYYRVIYNEYGKYGRVLHSELLRREHLEIAMTDLNITYFNPASAENLEISEVKEIMGGNFDWQITPEEMAMPKEQLISRVEGVISQGPPIISLYPYDNTPLDNLTAVVEMFK